MSKIYFFGFSYRISAATNSVQRRSLEEIITLEVGQGDKQAKYNVHKSILCATSPFFEAVCKPEWMKPEDKVIRLPEDDPEVIRLLVYWAYHGEICLPLLGESEVSMTLEEAMNKGWGLLVRLYLVAEKLQVDRLKNDSIDAMIQENKVNYLSISLISHIYENTLFESRLQQLILDIVRFEMPGERYYENMHLMPRNLLEDLAKANYSDESGPYDRYPLDIRAPHVEFCKRYHEHINENATCINLKNFATYV
ncbi:hypothetical protein V8E51_014403 [Hyaloscypha variabilis]